eukprot:767021-Hanusia_phi.AAC.2
MIRPSPGGSSLTVPPRGTAGPGSPSGSELKVGGRARFTVSVVPGERFAAAAAEALSPSVRSTVRSPGPGYNF